MGVVQPVSTGSIGDLTTLAGPLPFCKRLANDIQCPLVAAGTACLF